ncbi:MAG: cupin domain-containing protein [Salibacteraceae bacterium]
MPPKKINIQASADGIDEFWDPHILAELNGQHIRLAKLKGEFVWHHHVEEDEVFYVISGHLQIAFRDGNVDLMPGEMITIPRGVEHKPIAEDEVVVLLFEPANTVNTGSAVDSDMTKHKMKRL